MGTQVRQIIKIDEDLCNGCGKCVPACAEGALRIIDGKARMVSEKYCDGLGACLGECPRGAISFETREAEEFDEQAAMEHIERERRADAAAHVGSHTQPASISARSQGCAGHSRGGFVCPSARTIDRTQEKRAETPVAGETVRSELRQWPVKLYLVSPQASYFEDADLLVAADCTAFAYGSLHPDFVRGKTLVTGCPKFDDVELYSEKLTEIFRLNNIRSVTVLRMEVPCCSGMQRLTELAVAASGKNIPIESITIGLSGDIKAATEA